MEQERCYACLDLLFLASRPEYLQSECVSCNEHRKTVPVPDLIVIDKESSELVRSKDLCVVCMDPESTRNKLLFTVLEYIIALPRCAR